METKCFYVGSESHKFAWSHLECRHNFSHSFKEMIIFLLEQIDQQCQFSKMIDMIEDDDF